MVGGQPFRCRTPSLRRGPGEGGEASVARGLPAGPAHQARKKSGENLGVGPAENRRRGRGRPTLLGPEVADALVAEVTAGALLEDAARAAGVSPRTLRSWRARAWSSRPEDAPFIELERRLRAALPDGRIAAHAVESWEETAMRIEQNRVWWDELDALGPELGP
jgi:transposase-like protein